jgi:hypothetical protein
MIPIWLDLSRCDKRLVAFAFEWASTSIPFHFFSDRFLLLFRHAKTNVLCMFTSPARASKSSAR